MIGRGEAVWAYQRLETFFENYNGRYLGNIVVLVLTRSKALKIVAMALAYYVTCYLCYKYTPIKRNAILLFSLVLFLAMPQALFAQSVVWTAGFSNYVPSALISVAYIVLIRNITNDDPPRYSKYASCITLVMGFCGALFIENITIFNICLGVAVVGYVLVKFKKIFAAHIGFLIGAVTGAVWMFSNTAYRSISMGTDDYRTVPTGLHGMIEKCLENGYVICDQLVISNYPLCMVVGILLLMVTVGFIKSSENGSKNRMAVGAMTVNAACLFLMTWKQLPGFSGTSGILAELLWSKKFLILLTVLFGVSVFAVVMTCVPKGRKFRMLLPFYCIPVSVAPLLLVSPIGPRCFYISYLLTMVFAADLFGYIVKNTDMATINYKALLYSVGVVAILQAVVYISIFAPVYQYDTKRAEFAKLQSDRGENVIVVCDLPNKQYLWTSSPSAEPWAERYKLFYGLRDDATLNVVTVAEFEEYYKIYTG